MLCERLAYPHQAPPVDPPPWGAPLCPCCRQTVEDEVWALRARVREALLSVAHGGETTLVLPRFAEAVDGLGQLAAYQERGLLASPPVLEEQRRRLTEARESLVSGALSARTSPYRCLPTIGSAGGWQRYPSHPPLVTEILDCLADLRLVPLERGESPAVWAPRPGGRGLPPGAERRREARVPVRRDVVLHPGDRRATALDLSATGAGLRVDGVPDVGEAVWINFCHRCGSRAKARVRWRSAPVRSDPDSTGDGALGLEFVEPLPAAVLQEFAALAGPGASCRA